MYRELREEGENWKLRVKRGHQIVNTFSAEKEWWQVEALHWEDSCTSSDLTHLGGPGEAGGRAGLPPGRHPPGLHHGHLGPPPPPTVPRSATLLPSHTPPGRRASPTSKPRSRRGGPTTRPNPFQGDPVLQPRRQILTFPVKDPDGNLAAERTAGF